MMGRLEPEQKGIIPQMCEDLFRRISELAETENVQSTVEVIEKKHHHYFCLTWTFSNFTHRTI